MQLALAALCRSDAWFFPLMQKTPNARRAFFQTRRAFFSAPGFPSRATQSFSFREGVRPTAYFAISYVTALYFARAFRGATGVPGFG